MLFGEQYFTSKRNSSFAEKCNYKPNDMYNTEDYKKGVNIKTFLFLFPKTQEKILSYLLDILLVK